MKLIKENKDTLCTVLPGSPCGPRSPAAPGDPRSPGRPGNPAIPRGPAGPGGPDGPGIPGAPASPGSPLSPGGPAGPWPVPPTGAAKVKVTQLIFVSVCHNSFWFVLIQTPGI